MAEKILATVLPEDPEERRNFLRLAGLSALVGYGVYRFMTLPSSVQVSQTTTHLREQVEQQAQAVQKAVVKRVHQIEDAAVAITDSVLHTSSSATASAPSKKVVFVIKTLTPAAAVAEMAFATSDVLFVYHSGTADEQAALIESWTRSHHVNGHGRTPTVKQLDVRAGAGTAVAGALTAYHADESNVAVSVLTSSQALPSMAAALGLIANRKYPVVFNVALQQLNNELHELLDTTPLTLIKDSGYVILAPLGPQDIADTALLAQLLAARAGLPVIHAYDGIRGGRTLQQLVVPLDAGKQAPVSRQALAHWVQQQTLEGSDALTAVKAGSDKVSALTGRALQAIQYFGSKKAQTVLVVLGTLAPALAQAVNELNQSASHGHYLGLVAIRVLRPWSNLDFCRALPKTVTRIGVLEAGSSADGSLLMPDISAALFSEAWRGRQHPKLEFQRLVISASGLTEQLAMDACKSVLVGSSNNKGKASVLSSNTPTVSIVPKVHSDLHVVAVWGRSDIDFLVSSVAVQAHRQAKLHTSAYLSHDDFSAGGVTHAVIAASSKPLPVVTSELPGHSTAFVADARLLESLSQPIVSRLVPAGTLLVGSPLDVESLTEALPLDVRRELLDKDIRLLTVDVAKLGLSAAGSTAAALIPGVLVLKLLLSGSSSNEQIAVLSAILREANVGETQATIAIKLASDLVSKVAEVPLPASWAEELELSFTEEDNTTLDLNTIEYIPKARVIATEQASAQPRQVSKAEVAWRMLYKDTYASEEGVRPGHHDVFRVKLTKNQRLTPLEYHRNVFHLEMDIRGTGLTYEIGDALGVFGHNDKQEVDDFLAFYKLDPTTTVSFQHPDMSDKREMLTVAQLFQERLDIFGKPSQKFYEALAPHAQDSFQRAKLEWLGTEDKEGFKIRQFETYTYADVLHEFDSAKPPLSELMEMVPPIKPRHYSISSSMKMCPDSVHLLVVLVDWKTPKGRTRYGQCTRYLAGLDPADDVYLTVDIKPSAMHLPASPQQPIIMAGLGTGMAPFRAFIQEREWQRQQGIEVGPVMLYFGSRHRHEEYLYGDYLDAMFEEKLITHLGLAFSRDQKQKVYIQHKIVEDKSYIADFLRNAQGHFYLCGPTWPVPDVRKAICDGLLAETDMTQEQVDDFLDELKEEGRYVLEVY
eukprot:TRINITY_DN7440_c0_g1_i1.p1 TRINITY_DN7440_c0_g1~~TRINITY_DN7440_c0_g1_i1.p1  ORF type:complete len:1156 (+),score=375.21 TRINITY_DN7440_c0_g1_i1:49-3516(+)